MLDEKTVKEYLAELGYASVKDFQKAVMYPQYVDGIYGQQTENALISAINVKRNTKNFDIREFRCECGGRYCCGYPSTLKVEMLRNIQAIRDHYGRPITVTCGLRDRTYNSHLGGSIQNSLHISGRAVDFYQKGVTDTLANRKQSIKWIRTLLNHHYTYGNSIATLTANGKVSTYSVSAPYMGNALHTDVYMKVSPYDENGKLICDGEGGTATIMEMQGFFGTPKDGIISGQRKDLKKYYPSLDVEYGKGGSVCIKALQRWVGTTQDGILGQGTVKALQKRLIAEGYLSKGEDDGVFGKVSMKAWQSFLNDKLFKKETTPQEEKPSAPSSDEGNPPYKVIDVSDWQSQIDWAKVKASGVVGAIIRYGDGNVLDKRFDENMRNAKAAGLHIGSYIFSRAKSIAEAQREAERLFNACKPYAPDMPLYIDLEASGLGKYADECAIGFLVKMKALGGRGGVYANLNWWNNYLKVTARDYSSNPFWIAQYNDTMDYKPADRMGMWQYTSSGTVDGINGKVDMDKCFVAYWAQKPIDPPKKSVEELAREVLEGKWGKGDERKKRLTEAGYDYDAVQKCVNELVAKLDKIMDACKVQAEWMEGSKYDWESNPTIAKSKKRGTCVTYVACVLQRLGILPSGKYVWHDEGKVYGNNDKMTVVYPSNKTLHQLKGELIEGDIVIDGDPHDNGSGSHIFILTGQWSGSYPIIWDNHSAQDKGGRSYTYTRNRSVIAIIRLR